MSSSSPIKFVLGVGLAAAAAYYIMRKMKKAVAVHPLKPVPIGGACPAAPKIAGTEADSGFGDITDIAGIGRVYGMTGSQYVYVGNFETAWMADSRAKTLVVDRPRNLSVNEGQTTTAAVEKLIIELPGYDKSAVSPMAIQPAKYSVRLGDGKTACLNLVGGQLSSGVVGLTLSASDGSVIPAGTEVPALSVPIA